MLSLSTGILLVHMTKLAQICEEGTEIELMHVVSALHLH